MSCPMQRVATISGHVADAPSAAPVPRGEPGYPRFKADDAPPINGFALQKLGDEDQFRDETGERDWPSGLKMMAQKVRADVGMGYYITHRMDKEGKPFEKEVVVVTRPHFIDTILSENTQHYLWGGIEPASVAFFGAKVLFVLEGKEWMDMRKTMRPVLLPSNLDLVHPVILNTSGKLAATLMPLAEKGQAVDLHLAHQCYHLQAVSMALYNTELPALDNYPTQHTAHKSFNIMLEELGRRAFHADLNVQQDYETPNEQNNLWAKNKRVMHKEVMNSLHGRLTGTEKCPVGGKGDMLQQLIDACSEGADEAGGVGEVLSANLVELLFAGYTTITNTMSTAMHMLIGQPEQMRKARDEVDRIFGSKDPVAVTLEDLAKMTYLDSVMNETLRLYPPAPAVGRKLEQDTQLGGIILPEGTEVLCASCAVHRDPRYWEEPDKFMPERFEKQVTRGSWFPFSDGPRRCLGQHYARLIFKLGLSQHLKHFEFEAVPGYRFKTQFSGVSTGVWDDRTNTPCFPVIIRPRKA